MVNFVKGLLQVIDFLRSRNKLMLIFYLSTLKSHESVIFMSAVKVLFIFRNASYLLPSKLRHKPLIAR